MKISAKSNFVFALIVMLLAGYACVEKRNYAENIVIAQLQSDPPSLHACNASNGPAQYIFQYTQRTLTRIDMRTLQQIPVLVKALPSVSDDGKIYTFTLRDDVKWDDGTSLSVDDIIFTVKANKCPLTDNAEQRSVYDNILDIQPDAADSNVFHVLTKAAYYKNPNLFDEMNILQEKIWDPSRNLSAVTIPQLDAHDFNAASYLGIQEWAQNFNKGENGHNPDKLVGLGPYKVTQWLAGTTITLEKKSKWWGKNDTSIYNICYPEKIVFFEIADDPAIAVALKNKTLDVVTFISAAELKKLRASDSFNLNYYSGFTDMYGYNYIGINMKPEGKRPPLFTDKRVRRALAYLVPVEDLINTIAEGNGIRQASFIQPVNKEYYNDTLPLIPFDIEKAEQLLKEAGWVDTDGDNIRDKVIKGKKIPFTFYFTYRNTETNKQMALMIKDAMSKAGINLIPDPVDGNVVFKKMLSHDYDLILSAWSGSAIPEDPEQIFHTANWANHGYNFTGFGNALTDSLIRKSNLSLDKKDRIHYLKLLQAKVYEEQPYIFTYAVKRKIIISKRFEKPGMYAERPGVILNALKLKPISPEDEVDKK